MIDIDLIPADYRKKITLRRSLFVFGLICAGIIVFGSGANAAMSYWVGGIQQEVQVLQQQQKITTQRREDLARKEEAKKGFEHQLSLLENLRSGAAAEKMFITVDRALEGEEIWFDTWEFKRAGEIVDERPETVNTGYFIVVPAGEGKKKTETWRINTHMNIRGEAGDHSALSRFVRRLIEQPEIQDVRVLRTSSSRKKGGRSVSFEMAIIVHSGVV